MSLKAELEIWQSALKAAETDVLQAIKIFDKIGDTSKIEWNIGLLLATLGRHVEAIARYRRAIELDDWLVIAWFQCGISRFMLGQYEAAHRDFEAAHFRMRGNDTIKYAQLGLAHTIHVAEILFNRGLSLIYQGQTVRGMADMVQAAASTSELHHAVIGDAIQDQGKGYNPFSIPAGTLFEPSQGKLKNLASRDYMGKAVLIAATSPSDAYTTFTGRTRLDRGETPSGVPLPASHPLSRSVSVSNLRPARSASISAIPLPGDSTPIATRMSRTQRFGSMDERSPRTTEFTQTATRAFLGVPTDIYLPTMQPNTPPRKAPAPPGRNRLHIPSPSNALPLTPISTLAVTELVDDYYLPDTDWQPSSELLYTRLDRNDQYREKDQSRYASPARMTPSPSVYVPALPGPAFGLGRSGSMVSNRNVLGLARQGSTSTVGMRYEDETWEMSKIRVKVHIAGHTRAMSLASTATFNDVLNSLRIKFPPSDIGDNCTLLFKDEDGDMLSMVDEGDWEAGIDVARVLGGKLEIWVE